MAFKLMQSRVRADSGEIDAAGMFVNRRRRNGLVGHGDPRRARRARRGLRRRRRLRPLPLARRWRLRLPEVFDEDMALWATDADLAWRARLLGWRASTSPLRPRRHIRTYSPSKRQRRRRSTAACSSATAT